MPRPVSDDQFARLLATFERTAFHFETRPFYVLGAERQYLERFLAGSPVPPPDVDWHQGWLEQVATLTRQGKHVSRVRVLDEPPTGYQRWLLWADPWHAEAGEDIRYIPRSRAERVKLPLDHDWWLLDGIRVIVTRFAESGEIAGKELVTDPVTLTHYRLWQAIAIRDATPAGQIAAA
jgi:uncharacterized protein DUF6879